MTHSGPSSAIKEFPSVTKQMGIEIIRKACKQPINLSELCFHNSKPERCKFYGSIPTNPAGMSMHPEVMVCWVPEAEARISCALMRN